MGLKQYPLEDIKAPALLFVNGNCVLIKDNIKVAKAITRSDIALSNNVKVADRIDGAVITIKGAPIAFASASGVGGLFHELSLAKGARLPKISDCYICARVASGEWVKWAFQPAIHNAIGGITFGANSPMGEHTWTVYPDPLNPTEPLFTSTELDAAPTVPALTDAGKFMLRCLAIYGSGNDKVEFDTSGASIDISLSTEEAECDRLLKYGVNLTDIQITFKCKPKNISYETWVALSKIGAVETIGAITGVGSLPDLVVLGDKKDDFQFTLKSARVKDPSATFSARDSLMDELSFEALGDAYGDNKLTIGTAAANFAFETETPLVAAAQTEKPTTGEVVA